MSKTLIAIVLATALNTAAAGIHAHYPQTLNLYTQPTPTETTAVRSILGRSFGKEWTDNEKSSGHRVTFTVGHADLDGDGRLDLLVFLNDYGFGYCSSHGCSGYALMATPGGYAQVPVNLAFFYGTVTILPTVHRGMHDLRYDDSHYVFKWDGKQYQ